MTKESKAEMIKILSEVSDHYEDLVSGYFSRNDEPIFSAKEAMSAMDKYNSKQIEELKAENERLKEIVDNNKKFFDNLWD